MRASTQGHGFAATTTPARPEVVAGIDAAIEADESSVINISGGFTESCAALYDIVAVAFGTGHLVVAAAGNDGAAKENFPAAYPHVLTVASTDDHDGTSGFSTRSLGIDLAAPGEGIPAALPLSLDSFGYVDVDGTSFATPLVSAAAAWTWSARQAEIGHVTQLFELVRTSARDVGTEGWDIETGFGVLDLPGLLGTAMPRADASEPNDDIDQIVANGLFADPTPPLLRPTQKRARIGARLDWTEDPVDIYRVWVPPKRSVSFRVTATADVDLEVFRPTAKTVYYQDRKAALRRTLIGGSYGVGRAAESFRVQNDSSRGGYVLACVYKGPASAFLDANYMLNVAVLR